MIKSRNYLFCYVYSLIEFNKTATHAVGRDDNQKNKFSDFLIKNIAQYDDMHARIYIYTYI